MRNKGENVRGHDNGVGEMSVPERGGRGPAEEEGKGKEP